MLINHIIKLSDENISLLVKADEIDKEKIKVRLFNPTILKGGFADGYISLWEFNESALNDLINDLYKQLKESINKQKQLNENKRQATQRREKSEREDLFS